MYIIKKQIFKERKLHVKCLFLIQTIWTCSGLNGLGGKSHLKASFQQFSCLTDNFLVFISIFRVKLKKYYQKLRRKINWEMNNGEFFPSRPRFSKPLVSQFCPIIKRNPSPLAVIYDRKHNRREGYSREKESGSVCREGENIAMLLIIHKLQCTYQPTNSMFFSLRSFFLPSCIRLSISILLWF